MHKNAIVIRNLAPAGSTGNNTHTSQQVVRENTGTFVACQFVVEAVGATPTVTFKFQGSFDNTNFYDLPYVTEVGLVDSLQAGGRVVAPGVGAAVATLTTPAVGTYDVYIAGSVGTGGVAADAGNMEWRYGAAVQAVLAVPALGSQSFGPFRKTVDGATSISVNATAAATATVPYTATICAVRQAGPSEATATRVVTAVGTTVNFLSGPAARQFQYYRCITSANTNVTYRAELYLENG